MASSGQQPWDLYAAPALTTRNNPQYNVAFNNPTAATLSATEVQSGYPTAPDDGSMWSRVPPRASPLDLERASALNETAQPTWEGNYLKSFSRQARSLQQRQHSMYSSSSAGNQAPRELRTGMSPLERSQLGQIELPSLDDQDRLRKLNEELSKVRTWLEDSALSVTNLPSHARPEQRARSRTTPGAAQSSQSPSYKVPQPAERTLPSHPQRPSFSSPGVALQIPEDHDVAAARDSFEMDLDRPALDESTTPPATADPMLTDAQSTDLGISAAMSQSPDRYHLNEPWTDFAAEIDSARIKEQPPSSNAAIEVFTRKARDLETASLAATLGSRRRSEADLTSIASRDGANVKGPFGASQANLFRRFLIRRNSSNAKKRKDGHGDDSAQVSDHAPPYKRESQLGLSPLKRVINRPKSPRLEMAAGQYHHGRSPSIGKARKTLNRMRSRSEIGGAGTNTSALAQQWARQGGPPVPSMRPQEEGAYPEVYQTQEAHVLSADDGDGDDDALQDTSATMSLQVSEAPTGSDRESFVAHIHKLNAGIEPYMLARLTNEQDKRYRRLIESRTRHDEAIQRRACTTGEFCNALGRGPRYPAPSQGRASDSASPIFWVTSASPTEEGSDDGERAHFPEGIPLPPVSRLPAEFECPLCFQVKKIVKPSDWTKHVNEDIQPFTCTFPDCSEAKSFKRKADWVRHESERHRHLEAWQCDLEGCYHRCYRRDNFVQHLVREHRLPEPTKIGKSAYRTGTEPGDIVAQHVERCRQESTSKPEDEPCRFCGVSCTSWKKLSVHLAQHMQQISIPILKLVGIDIPPSAPPGLTVTSSRRQSRQPFTPVNRSPGSRTPSISMPGSSNPQSSISSGEGWEMGRTPMLSVTDTSQTATASGQRQRATSVTPSLGSWHQPQPSISGKERSRYPVMGPPSGSQAQQGSGLGLSIEQSPQQQYHTHSQFYGNQPITPPTPVQRGQSMSYHSSPQPHTSSYSSVWSAYPSSNMGSASEQTQIPHVEEMQGILSGPEFSESPVNTSVPQFSATTGYPMMPGVPDYRQEMAVQHTDNQYYGMSTNMQYSMAPQENQAFAQSRSAYMPHNDQQEEPQHYHSSTYPPHFYHSGSG